MRQVEGVSDRRKQVRRTNGISQEVLLDRFEAEPMIRKASARSYQGYIKQLRAFWEEWVLVEIAPRVVVA